MFSCEFCEISKNIHFKEHLWTSASKWTSECILEYIKTQFKKHICCRENSFIFCWTKGNIIWYIYNIIWYCIVEVHPWNNVPMNFWASGIQILCLHVFILACWKTKFYREYSLILTCMCNVIPNRPNQCVVIKQSWENCYWKECQTLTYSFKIGARSSNKKGWRIHVSILSRILLNNGLLFGFLFQHWIINSYTTLAQF